jgi:hypothetical protein
VNREDGHLEELFTKAFSVEESKEAIKNISNKKQPGHDKIFPEFNINPGPKTVVTLLLIYNKFWTGKISLPADWTKTVIILILKPGKPKKKMESYQPITLTSILANFFERMISTRLKLFLES